MLRFLRQAVHDVDEGVGWWSSWYDPDPLAVPAKERETNNKPKKENAQTSEVRIEVDEGQFTNYNNAVRPTMRRIKLSVMKEFMIL